MQIMVDSIKVPDRIRKEIGSLDSLKESLTRCGQLNPITVSRDFELIAGFRRLSAAREMGWKMIDANVVDGLTAQRCLEMELEENIHRKDFTPEELLEGIRRLEKLRHPSLGVRVKKAMSTFFSKIAFWRRKPSQETKTSPKPVVAPTEDKLSATDDDGSNYGV